MQDFWRQWLNSSATGLNEKPLLRICLCVLACTCASARLGPTLPTPCIPVSPSGGDMWRRSLFYLLRGHALRVSLCCCHSCRKALEEAEEPGTETVKTRLFPRDRPGSPGDGVCTFMKHDSCLEGGRKKKRFSHHRRYQTTRALIVCRCNAVFILRSSGIKVYMYGCRLWWIPLTRYLWCK